MRITTYSLPFQGMLFLLWVFTTANSQQPSNIIPKPTSYTTKPVSITAMFTSGNGESTRINGKLTFKILSANSDDTMTGRVTIDILSDDRLQIAKMLGRPLQDIPQNLTAENVTAVFEKGASAPVINIVIKSTATEYISGKMTFTDVVVGINAHDGNVLVYTPEEIEALITVWVKQIEMNRPRVGIIRRFNKSIKGER